MKNESNINQKKGLRYFCYAICSLIGFSCLVLLLPSPEQAGASTNDSDFSAVYNRISSAGAQTRPAHIFPSSPVEGVEEPNGDTREGQPETTSVPRPAKVVQVRADAKPKSNVQGGGVAGKAISKSAAVGCQGTMKKILGKVRCIDELITTPFTWYIKTDPVWKQEMQKYASVRSGGNRHFVATLHAENGGWTLGKHKKANGNGSWDYGLCGFNSTYNMHLIKDPKFQDWKFQVEKCWEKYQSGTTFYAYITPRWKKIFNSLSHD